MQFNEKLTSLRKSMGLSQEELGAELKVSRQTISKWESAQSYPRLSAAGPAQRLFWPDPATSWSGMWTWLTYGPKISAAKNWIPSTTTWASPKNSSSGISSSPVQALSVVLLVLLSFALRAVFVW